MMRGGGMGGNGLDLWERYERYEVGDGRCVEYGRGGIGWSYFIL